MLLEWTLWILSTVSLGVAKALLVRWLLLGFSKLWRKQPLAEPYFTITVAWR